MSTFLKGEEITSVQPMPGGGGVSGTALVRKVLTKIQQYRFTRPDQESPRSQQGIQKEETEEAALCTMTSLGKWLENVPENLVDILKNQPVAKAVFEEEFDENQEMLKEGR